MACFDYPSINHIHFAFCLWFKQINGNVFLLSQNVSNLYGTMWVIISRSYDVILLRSKTICLWLVLFICLTFSQKWRDRHWKQNKGEQISAFAICYYCYENAKEKLMRSWGKELPSWSWMWHWFLCAVMIILSIFVSLTVLTGTLCKNMLASNLQCSLVLISKIFSHRKHGTGLHKKVWGLMCFYNSVKIIFSCIELLMWIITGVENRIIKRFMKLNYAFFLI